MISQLLVRFPVTWLCSQLGVARSGFYAAQQRQRNPGHRAQQNAAITAQVAMVFEQHRGFYGALRIHRELGLLASRWDSAALLG